MFFFSEGKILTNVHILDIQEFLTWTKEDWCNNYDRISSFKRDLLEHLENCHFSFDPKSQNQFFHLFFQLFKRFSQMFIVDEEDNNTTFIDPLLDLTGALINLLNNSKFAAKKFLHDKHFEWFILNILKNSKFSVANCFTKLNDISNIWFFEDRKVFIEMFLTVLLNTLRLNDSNILEEANRYFLTDYLMDYQQKLERKFSNLSLIKDKKILEKPIFSFKIICFLINMHLLNSDDDRSLLLKAEQSQFFLDNLKDNLEGRRTVSKDTNIIQNQELLCYFICFTRNPGNMKFLYQAIPYILQFLQNKWTTNIQIFAAQFLFCLLSDEMCKKLLRNNENFLQFLKTKSTKNSCQDIEYLKENILCEINSQEDVQSNQKFLTEKSLMVFSSHADDKKTSLQIMSFLKKTFQFKNILQMDSEGLSNK